MWRNYKFGVLTFIRILIILALCLVLGLIFPRADMFFSQLIITSLIVLLSLELIRFVTKTNRDLTKLFTSIVHNDFSASFSNKQLGGSFSDLSEALSNIIHAFRGVKIEKEAQLQLLQVIIDQVEIGIVAVRSPHEIIFKNQKAVDILDIPGLNSWNIDIPLIAKIDEEIKSMRSQGNKLLELEIGEDIKQLAFHMNRTVFMEDELRLMTFHDIRSEIEQKEIEAWYKLIRILTHEVMNSITPLSSLTETILMLLEDKNGQPKEISQLTNEQLADIRNSLKTIQGRSKGILDFVDAYRRLTNIPHPEFEQVKLKDLLEHVRNLYDGELKKNSIDLEISLQNNDLSISADRHLMEQVMINLISNSIFALEAKKDRKIAIKAFKVKSSTTIEVSDNGKGIPQDKIDKIFIPFFSTRENGSGIGLSLSKQIIHLHHGRIKVRSTAKKGTTFRIDL